MLDIIYECELLNINNILLFNILLDIGFRNVKYWKTNSYFHLCLYQVCLIR